MANHYSALKRARQTERRTLANRMNTTRLRSDLRHLRESLTAGDKQAARQAYSAAISRIDKSIRKGVLHRNTGARYKARLTVRLNALLAAQ